MAHIYPMTDGESAGVVKVADDAELSVPEFREACLERLRPGDS
jgi:hypothetical protein